MQTKENESDWKLFRKRRSVALERFCRQVLDEVRQISEASDRSSHERYLEVWELLRDRDRKLDASFSDPSRSTFLTQLIAIRAAGLLTDEEFLGFSDEVRGSVQRVLDF